MRRALSRLGNNHNHTRLRRGSIGQTRAGKQEMMVKMPPLTGKQVSEIRAGCELLPLKCKCVSGVQITLRELCLVFVRITLHVFS